MRLRKILPSVASHHRSLSSEPDEPSRGSRAVLSLAFWFSVCSTAPATAQSGSLIEDEIDRALETSVWRAGPFRLTPQIRIGGGYDSNGVSSPTEPVEDVTFSLAPGLRAVVPLGRRGLIDLYEELDFVYYRELEQLRDVFDVTRVGLAFGGKNLVARVQNEFRDEKIRPSTEFDIPLDQRSNRLRAELSLALGWRNEVTLGYQNLRLEYLDPEAQVRGVLVSSLLDRREETYHLRLSRRLTGKTAAVLEGAFQLFDFDEDAAQRDGQGAKVMAGFAFSPTGNVRGEALLGFKNMVPDFEGQADFRGLIGAVDVRMGLGRRLVARGLYSRDTVPSVLTSNWFFVENRYGGSLDIYLARRFFIRPGVVFGRNTYPRAFVFLNTEGERVEDFVEDRFQNYLFSFNYKLTPTLVVSVGANYENRESNLPFFAKDRFLLNVGLTSEF
ncbi:MAG: outer membrane beta-barrel protein [Acidobacteriota bacterium]